MKALNWAIQQRVDIINCSFVLFRSDPSLEEVIRKADTNGIAIICSTSDEGYIRTRVWPAAYVENTISNLFPVAPIDEFGRITRYGSDVLASYLLQGEAVDASRKGDKAEESDIVTGSSVATAMASGLASIVIGCHKSFVKLRRDDAFKKDPKEVILKAFHKMHESDPSENKIGPKRIMPKLLFPQRERDSNDTEKSDTDFTLGEHDMFIHWLLNLFSNVSSRYQKNLTTFFKLTLNKIWKTQEGNPE
jgi:hypothetical protein